MSRKKSELCKYVLVGCPKKECKAAHSREELYIQACPLKHLCLDLECRLVHPKQSIVKLYSKLLNDVVKPSESCPYGKDCPGMYCPYDYDKFSLEWTDVSEPDFKQPLVFKCS